MRIRMRTLNNCITVLLFSLFPAASLFSQEVRMTEMAPLEQVYGEKQQSSTPLSMNDLGLDSGGYVLYEAEVATATDAATLSVENIRDYAAVFIDGTLKGGLTDEKKELSFPLSAGKHLLQLYVENIGRITYGPEILDNTKGLFGTVMLNEAEVADWSMTPLLIRDCATGGLNFTAISATEKPCFFKGSFSSDAQGDIHLDVSGWGMGEVWINGSHQGTYWEESPQQSIQIQADALVKGENEVIVFELKNNSKQTMSLSEKTIFK